MTQPLWAATQHLRLRMQVPRALAPLLPQEAQRRALKLALRVLVLRVLQMLALVLERVLEQVLGQAKARSSRGRTGLTTRSPCTWASTLRTCCA